ncbi:hypothetical protein BDK51DRAFT_49958 [Blyttiomyces helicus]|uniref:Uncharacterized protein n=1 Tax=Blyttiomyces helicus TaxID=388810 RepID=A0A4P9W0Y1_9FUNG|nr:hypothetical protein BDK51DRAFT_49958 [Blyttiomyces helicus]|eukprot:RKO85292.1 hypothetical protein BDK51DRAFT_49958 [Blyttiomyces helicus]
MQEAVALSDCAGFAIGVESSPNRATPHRLHRLLLAISPQTAHHPPPILHPRLLPLSLPVRRRPHAPREDHPHDPSVHCATDGPPHRSSTRNYFPFEFPPVFSESSAPSLEEIVERELDVAGSRRVGDPIRGKRFDMSCLDVIAREIAEAYAAVGEGEKREQEDSNNERDTGSQKRQRFDSPDLEEDDIPLAARVSRGKVKSKVLGGGCRQQSSSSGSPAPVDLGILPCSRDGCELMFATIKALQQHCVEAHPVVDGMDAV